MWNLFPAERLRSWQNFRLYLNKLELEDAIRKCNHLWAYCPYQKYYLTTENIEMWPNPWELLHENIYCDLARALGIVYTLYLTDHQPKIEIRIYNDTENNEQYNLVYLCNGKYVLNYDHDTVVNKTQITKKLKLKKQISIQELQLDKIK
jgi:hypothetical protein